MSYSSRIPALLELESRVFPPPLLGIYYPQLNSEWRESNESPRFTKDLNIEYASEAYRDFELIQ